jgi:2-dehydropantoate 2-reductase
MRIAVIGSGAMGSVFGAALARGGDTVTFLDNRPDVVAAIQRDGLTVEGALGKLHSRPPATTDVAALGQVDCALVMVDASATPAAALTIAKCLGPDGFAMTLQNGIGNVEALVEVLGQARVVAGSTYNSAASLGPGRSLHSNAAKTVLGEIDGKPSARTAAIAEHLTKGGLTTEVTDNAMGVVWSKFVRNCVINPVSAITGMRPSEIARDPGGARLLDLLLDEILAVVERAGIRLADKDIRAGVYDLCWDHYNRPSMLQHVEAARMTEIDALNGALVHRARALGMTVPVNEAMTMAIKAIEATRRERAAHPELDQAALEAAAKADPRNGRWGTG